MGRTYLTGNTWSHLLNPLCVYSRRVNRCPVSFVTSFARPSTLGSYFPYNNEIMIATQKDVNQQVKTLAHEIGHSIMHKGQNPKEESKEAYAKAEVEAEMFAMLLMRELGCNTGEHSMEYINTYSEKAGMKSYVETFRKVWPIVKNVLTHVKGLVEVAA